MRIIIAGGRDFIPNIHYLEWVAKELFHLTHNDPHTDHRIVSGGTRGADAWGEQIANVLRWPIDQYPARWEKFGKSAGYRRNVIMAQNADALIALPGGKGTNHMINTAQEYGLYIKTFGGHQ